MSVTTAASPSPSSFPYHTCNRSRLRGSLLTIQPAFPSLLLASRGISILSRKSTVWRIRVLLSGEEGVRQREVQGELSMDAFLSAAEILCVLPPSIVSIGFLVGLVAPGAPKLFQLSVGNAVFAWQFFLLASAVAIGGLIRRRQWRRICWENERAKGVDLIARIEKVEQDVKSSATIVRALSRQLEKIGIRFRLTRKALKEPIAETAALAHKNSEATRALAMQEDILEKELTEIQKVLLAIQDQQQKQLDLILAIAKAGRLLDSKPSSAPILGKKEGQELETLGAENNRL
ncbi:hypothetical protein AXF42_Ash017653 [Apostasia shenzhenica]|uniref:Uncharacterized protein n=1 Tax=Apostasia shenzhenica TaxID=1088818 RepID=A0A2I0A5F5_9ASPA|nr:hypothetical protein AXF42_Ash017653 [Apostasia shenzhenica]